MLCRASRARERGERRERADRSGTCGAEHEAERAWLGIVVVGGRWRWALGGHRLEDSYRHTPHGSVVYGTAASLGHNIYPYIIIVLSNDVFFVLIL